MGLEIRLGAGKVPGKISELGVGFRLQLVHFLRAGFLGDRRVELLDCRLLLLLDVGSELPRPRQFVLRQPQPLRGHLKLAAQLRVALVARIHTAGKEVHLVSLLRGVVGKLAAGRNDQIEVYAGNHE